MIYKTNYNKPPALKKIAISLILLALVLIFLVTYFLIAKAEIIITPTTKANQSSFEILVAADQNSELSGQLVSSIVSLSDRFQVTNPDQEKIGTASGEIKIINNHTVDQTLVATTRFLTPDNFLFRLDKQVDIPSQAEIRARITADQETADGDIQPPVNLTIPGLRANLQELIYGVVDQPFTGGVQKIGELTESDLIKARLDLSQQALEHAKVNFIATFLEQNSDNINTPEITININVTDEATGVNLGEKTFEFEYTLTGQIQAVIFNEPDLVALTQAKFISLLNRAENFISLDPKSINIEIKDFNLTDQTASLVVTATGQSIYQNSDLFDYQQLIGKNKTELADYFRTQTGIEKNRS